MAATAPFLIPLTAATLLLLAAADAAPATRSSSVELWFWGYGSEGHDDKASSSSSSSAPSCRVGRLIGCFNDSAWNNKPTPGRRTLQHKVSLAPGVALSQESCAAACCVSGYGAADHPSSQQHPNNATPAVAGVEYGVDCFCDRSFTPQLAHAHRTNASDCAAKSCTGEPCGGACRVLVYEYSCDAKCASTPPPKPAPKPLVPPSIWSVMVGNGSAGSAAATGVIGGCGHEIADNGTFRIPDSLWLTAQVSAAHAANLTFVPLVAGCTLQELRALIFSPPKIDAFIAAMVKDAIAHDYDGINFDLEMAGFGKPEQDAYATMLVKLQAALTHARGAHRPLAVVSACVGDTKNGLVSPIGVQAAPPDGSMQLYDMGLYTSSTVGFESELLAALTHIKRAHLTAGLSASTDSWIHGPPTDVELHRRFQSLAMADVSRIALFGTEFLDAYAPFLRSFIRQH